MIHFQVPVMLSQTDTFTVSELLLRGHVSDQSKLLPSARCEIKWLLSIPISMQPTIPSQTLSVMQLLNIDLCASLDCVKDRGMPGAYNLSEG
jgi:hypothetical protein